MTAGTTAVLAAAYDLDGTLPTWIDRVARALHPLLGRAHGTIAYQVRPPHEPRFSDIVAIDTAPGIAELPMAAATQMRDSEWTKLYRFMPRVSWANQDMVVNFGVDHQLADFFRQRTVERFGFDDVFGLTVSPPGASPVQFTFPRLRYDLPRAERRWLERLAAHIEAGLRLRHAAEQIDAVLDPRGRLLHAEGEATNPEARAALHDAARDRARVRSARALDPVSAIDRWTALVLGRWSVVDRVDTDGQRFLIARRNDATEPLEPWMTTRVRQVAQLVARGLSNKHIAYELGLAESTVSRTVRELLGRLGLRSRYELAALLRSGEPPDSESRTDQSSHGQAMSPNEKKSKVPATTPASLTSKK